MLAQFKKLIHRPYGIILVTGPTGSGKTTTLYATLKHLYTPKKKIITIEDPVEYLLDGISQCQINTDINFTFASGLRSMLRHDPDIIMLGEIRDSESGEIAIRASLTGHFVLSTLHTNTSLGAITRLTDIGLAPYLVFACLQGVLAQRLMMTLCPVCKEAYLPTPNQLSALGIYSLPDNVTVYRPVGCRACNSLGYKGRFPIFELLEVTPSMRSVAARKGDQIGAQGMKEIMSETAFTTLRTSAVNLFMKGRTSLEEVLGITADD
jgi:general secretion pathway protein E